MEGLERMLAAAKSFLKTEIAIGIFAASFIIYWWSIPLQTQDGPNHKKVAVTLERLPNSPVERAVYKSNIGPFMTNELFHLAYLYLSRFVSIDTYEKLFTGFFLLLLPISYRYFLSVWSPPSLSLWALVLPLLFFPLFIRGMYNFLASVPLTFVALGLLKKGVESKRIFYLPLFLLCCYFSFLAHPFPFFLLPVCAIFIGVQQWNKSYFGMYLFILVVFLVLGFFVPLINITSGIGKVPYRFVSLPGLLLQIFNGTFVVYSVPHIIVLTPYFIFLLWLAYYSWRNVAWKHKVYWVACLLMLAFFPNSGRGGAYLNDRFLLFLWCFLPIGIRLVPRLARLVQVLCVTTFIAHGAVVWVGMSKVATVVSEVQKILESVPSFSRLYTINFDSKGPALNYHSLHHVWAVYDHSKILFSPNLFAHIDLMPLSRLYPSSPTYFPSLPENFAELVKEKKGVERKDLVDTSFLFEREEGYKKLIATASYYDYWLVLGPPPDFVDILESAPGLRKVAQKGNIYLWHLEKAKAFVPQLPVFWPKLSHITYGKVDMDGFDAEDHYGEITHDG